MGLSDVERHGLFGTFKLLRDYCWATLPEMEYFTRNSILLFFRRWGSNRWTLKLIAISAFLWKFQMFSQYLFTQKKFGVTIKQIWGWCLNKFSIFSTIKHRQILKWQKITYNEEIKHFHAIFSYFIGVESFSDQI